MREGLSPLVRREQYAPPAFWIRTVDLTFDLDPLKTIVMSRMQVERNTDVPADALRLHGDELTLLRVQVDGQSVSFRHDDGMLVIDSLKDRPPGLFTLEIRNTCAPDKNTELSGLYTSGGGLFTQCEAEGFRRITYFLDRPDVMAVYTVTLKAAKAAYPVLLCNGNLVEETELDNGRHCARWHDPYPKPSYLFALVAAELVTREQRIVSRSGREHLLQVHVRRGDLDKTDHAMQSLLASIAWDEARFGLPLDLDRFMIVAVGDFNMGAMENKGLNIFNTKYVLANPATATDVDFEGIESVVGHEYFHNWTGNRITCRDWFQLSLKEGLTVFRDQEFSMDMTGPIGSAASASARAVKRIEDVRRLRQFQFPEDAGPMAHPVRPDSYIQINNFYTATVYEKGAEVVRMMQTLVGRHGFERGMTLYFERHDGQAVTCDDFAQAIADANPGSALAANLDQFKHWYAQSGTPRLAATGQWDAEAGTYTLDLRQTLARGAPMVIPVAFGLVARDGTPLPVRFDGESEPGVTGTMDRLIVMTGAASRHVVVGLPSEPVPSLLRGFSAPVLLDDGLGDADRLVLLQHDTDPFNRWEAAQKLALARLLAAVQQGDGDGTVALDNAYVDAMRAVLRSTALEPAFKDLVLTLPAEGYIAEQLQAVDPQRVQRARNSMRLQLAQALRTDWAWAWGAHQVTGGYSPDAASAGRRAFSNLALGMLCLDAVERGDAVWPGRAYQRFKDAGNMTERYGALSALVHAHAALAEPALAAFHTMFAGEPLVIDKWFLLQATAPEQPDGRVFERARSLLAHPDFSLRNPNRVRSLVMALCMSNPGAFHRPDGAGYDFWADRLLEVDAVNPQLAARIARVMDRWSQLVAPYRGHARAALERVAATADLSADVREIIGRALTAPAGTASTGSTTLSSAAEPAVGDDAANAASPIGHATAHGTASTPDAAADAATTHLSVASATP